MGRDNALYKFNREGLIVQEDPRVLMVPVEPILHLTHGVHGILDVLVAREHDERRIFALALWLGVYSGIIVCYCVRGALKVKYER
jgi:hypothetical protein